MLNEMSSRPLPVPRMLRKGELLYELEIRGKASTGTTVGDKQLLIEIIDLPVTVPLMTEGELEQQREETERKIQKYQSILNQIREFSGEEDVDKLAARFIKQEEENFALFNYVNELNNELETLQEQVEELKSKIDDQRRLNQQRSEQQQETLSVLNAKLREVCSTADTAKEELQISSRKLTDLLNGIEMVFHLVRCDNSPLLDLLGSNAHVTPYNVLLFLGIIERRSNDLLNTVSYLEKKAKKGGDPSGCSAPG